MSEFRARMFLEHGELSQRVNRLKEFIVSDQFDTLPEVERTDLKEQLRHMEQYHLVLSRRVGRQCNEA